MIVAELLTKLGFTIEESSLNRYKKLISDIGKANISNYSKAQVNYERVASIQQQRINNTNIATARLSNLNQQRINNELVSGERQSNLIQQRINNNRLAASREQLLNQQTLNARQQYDQRQIRFNQQQISRDNSDKKARQATVLGGALAVGASGTALFGGALKTSLETFGTYEKELIRVRAKTGASPEDMKALKAQSLDLGRKTQFDPIAIVQAYSELAGQNYNAKQIQAMTPHVLDVSTVTGESTQNVSRLMSEMLHQFRKAPTESNFKQMADIIGVSTGKMGLKLQQLEYTMKYSGALSNVAGIDPKQAVTLAVALGRGGLLGSTPGTSIRSIISDATNTGSLIQSGKHKNKTKGQMLKEIGVNPFDAAGNFNFFQFAEQLNKATEKMTKTQKLDTFRTIFGKTAMTAATMISELAKRADDGTQSLRDIYNQFDKFSASGIANEMKTGWLYNIQLLTSSLLTLGKTIGEAIAPMLEKMANGMQKIIDYLSAHEHITKMIGYFLLFGFAISGVVTALASLGFAFLGLQAFMEALGAETLFAGFLTGAGWILGVVAAVVVLALAIEDLWTLWEGGESVIGNFADYVNKIMYDTFGVDIPALFDRLLNDINTFATATSQYWEVIKSSAAAVWGGIKDLIIGLMGDAIDSIKNMFSGLWQGIKDGVKNFTSNVTMNNTNNFALAKAGYAEVSSAASSGASKGMKLALNNSQKQKR